MGWGSHLCLIPLARLHVPLRERRGRPPSAGLLLASQARREEGALHSCSLFALQLSETTAESHLMEKELEELKTHSRRRK